MIFAVGREINVVTFKTKITILIIKLLRMRAGIYMLFPLVGWKKVTFSRGKSWKKGSFYQKGAGILYLSTLDTLYYRCKCAMYRTPSNFFIDKTDLDIFLKVSNV